ncbi:MAG TPA: hypothetical protein VGU61_14300 [Noviherbaspirillum sp.]|uniref:hypothetical protein n=1 Tax=Noviherbaspirillum sp. TaxID=1926288 RepID=UPI002DDCCBA6|nr:hypothetical protein [Noviherbaspirillum sp.]HEV2611437.1 hypothetical protein [Noviherbaspirillum sp.]
MAESLADIETLALRCRSERSKEHIAEAVLCYRGGAYRAAIVSTWIAVVFDLIDKIRELAASGEGKAKDIELQYERYIAQIEAGNDQGLKGALEFERKVLETCRNELQMLDPHQFTDLLRLRDDRHRCAHPSFQRIGEPYRPSAEHARLHLRNAVIHVLSEPPVQGKAALAKLRALILSQFFPNETDKVIVQFRASSLARPSEALVSNFVDMIVFGFVTEGDNFYGELSVMSALKGVFEMFPDKVERRLKQQLNKAIRDVPDAGLMFAVAILTHVRIGWNLLDEDAKGKVLSFINCAPPEQVVPGLASLNRLEALAEAVAKRVAQLTFDELVLGIEHGLGILAKDRAIHFLGGAYSFNRVNEIMGKVIFPIFEYLIKEDFERIIRLPVETNADIPGATSYRTFIQKLRAQGTFSDAELDALLSANKAGYLAPQPESAAD